MNPDNYSPEILELIAKIILLSKGGTIYPHPDKLRLRNVYENGELIPEHPVSSIHYTPGYPDGGCYVYFSNKIQTLTDEPNRQQIWRYIVNEYPFPDRDILIEEKMLKDRLRLRERNLLFITTHGDLTFDDFEMVTEYQYFMNVSREAVKDNPVPLPGDIVEGAYYNGAHPFKNGLIESRPGWKKRLSICAGPYVPFVHFVNKEQTEIGMSVSGGPFFGLNPEDLEYVREGERYFCDWGNCGPCANGAIDFPVRVNRWRVKEGVEY